MGDFTLREEFSVTRERGNFSLLLEQIERWRRRESKGTTTPSPPWDAVKLP